MKKDIFKGKIKKEYFSYILVYMIFFAMLFIAVGVLCLYASLTAVGVIAFILAFFYVFLELLVIRRFPKYKKIRRILFNSDIYFTDSTSNEYFGGSRTPRGRRNKAAFDLVTTFAEVEKGMGDKRPVRYTVYSALALIMALFGLVDLIALPLLYENGTVFSNVSQNVFLFCNISVGFVCIALAILFFFLTFKVGIRETMKNDKWKYELYTSLIDISVRKNSKKHKFWYNADQLQKIETLVVAASQYAELKVDRKGNRSVSFKVVDNRNGRVIFTGYLTQ